MLKTCKVLLQRLIWPMRVRKGYSQDRLLRLDVVCSNFRLQDPCCIISRPLMLPRAAGCSAMSRVLSCHICLHMYTVACRLKSLGRGILQT